MLLQQLTYEINDKIYFLLISYPDLTLEWDLGTRLTSYKNLRNLLRQLLSCKISYKIQLKNLKYPPPQSLACKVHRSQRFAPTAHAARTKSTIKCNSHFCVKSTISNGNRTEWSPIRSVIIRVITKSDDRAAGVRFVYHEYDYRPNWTTRSPIAN